VPWHAVLQVSAFIVLAKEQAEQEQLIRSQHRQHYSMHPAAGLHGGLTNGYMLPQQAYLPHQQQQKPGTMLSLGRGSWPAGTGSPQAGGYTLAAVSSAPSHPMAQGLAQQQQMWGAVPAMLHQQTSLPQVPMGSGYMAAGQDASAAGGVLQYTNTYMMAAGQLMQGAGGPAAGSLPGANPGSLLPQHQQQYLLQAQAQAQHQSQQQQQHQQLMMCAAGSPAAVPVSQCQLGPQMAVGPVGTAASSAPSACPMAPAGGSNDLVLQHAAAASSHGAAAGNSPLASSAGGSTFVQDMLQSLNYAAGGPGMSAAGQQQQCLVLPQTANWMAEASSKAAVTSWAMPAHPAAGASRLNGLTVAAGVLDSSPSFSTASSTRAATNTGFALPVMHVASSTACA